MLAELTLALNHVHKCGFIHKDVKVENVMLDHRGHIKLVDFGLAEVLKAEVGTIQHTGSIINMAPELILYCTGGRHTDWWAFGILSYELLTGRSPWGALPENARIQVAQQREKVISSQINFPSKLSPPATLLLKSLLQRDYKMRLGTKSDREVQKALFFSGVDWQATARLECLPLFTPSPGIVDDKTKEQALASYLSRSEIALSGEESWTIGLGKVTKHPGLCAKARDLPLIPRAMGNSGPVPPPSPV